MDETYRKHLDIRHAYIILHGKLKKRVCRKKILQCNVNKCGAIAHWLELARDGLQ